MKPKQNHLFHSTPWRISLVIVSFLTLSFFFSPQDTHADNAPAKTRLSDSSETQERTIVTPKTETDAHSILITLDAGQSTEEVVQAVADSLNVDASAVDVIASETPKTEVAIETENTTGDAKEGMATTTVSVTLPQEVTAQEAAVSLYNNNDDDINTDTEISKTEEPSTLPKTTIRTEPNIKRRMSVTPNDPLYDSQWHHSGTSASVNSPQGWDTTTGSSTVVVAVVDTGVDTDHPDIANNIWVNTDEIAGNGIDDDGNGFVDDRNGYDFTTNSSNPNPNPDGEDEDEDGSTDGGVSHGTHIAGIIGAEGNNGSGVSGIMWDVQIMPVQVLDDEGSGFDSHIAKGIRYAADNGADIINLSFGGAGSTTVLANAVEYALSKNSILVGAAGNESVNLNDDPFYPACYSGVIGVASVGTSGRGSNFSNYGADCVDVAAPGELIYSTLYTNDAAHGFTDNYGIESGTSMAAPMVSGVTGLIRAKNPSATVDQVEQLLTSSFRSVTTLSSRYGVGIIDASRVGQRLLMKTVTAYDNSKRKIKFKKNFTYADRQPYLKWTTTGAKISHFYVYFGTNKNADPRISGRRQTKRNYTPPKRISGDEKSYYLRVQAVDMSGRVSNVLTYDYNVDSIVPAAKNVSAKNGSKAGTVTVRWSKVTGQHVKEYQVFRVDPGSRQARLIGRTQPTRVYFTDKNAESGKTYTYYVKTRDDLGNSKNSKKMRVRVR